MLRLDQWLTEHETTLSKSKAQALIKAGKVAVNGVVIMKPAKLVNEADVVEILGQDHPWVSRGGIKLDYALSDFQLDVKGMLALDIGASTGGFTDVLLQAGAVKVYAVDVGTDQLHPQLRDDARVISLEQTNARDLNRQHVSEPVDLIVCDASFISLEKVLPAPLALGKKGCQLITLIKPQFEVGKDKLGKGGIVKEPALHERVCVRISDWLEKDMGWQVRQVSESPILGPKGNKEFLLWAVKRV